jgi:phosphoglycolate phosphatase
MRAVIFDLDGTLIDSAPDIAATVNHVLAADGLAPLEERAIREMIGDGAKTLLERAFAAHGKRPEPRHLMAFVADYQANPVAETVCYPGIRELVAALHGQGRPLGICTNKPMAPTRPILEALGLTPYFSAVVGGDATPYKKPDPRHLAATLAALEVSDAVMIGDHVNDMRVAEGLGIPGIFAAWGYGEAESPFVAATPADIVEILIKMG